MAAQSQLMPGFNDYGVQANEAFRICLDALSRPGTIHPFATTLEVPDPLLPATAAVLITLADFETSVWLDEALQASEPVRDYLRFHTGAKEAATPDAADFAAVSNVTRMPAFDQFSLGTPEYPDRSTTIILQVAHLTTEGMMLAGPGVNGRTGFSASPAPERLAEQLAENRQRFPLGVDLIFVSRTHIAALPRSVHVNSEA